MKTKSLGYLVAALGIVLTAVGLWLARTFPEAAGAMAALPYVLIGLGCGAFGHGVGALANAAVFRKHPDVARAKRPSRKRTSATWPSSTAPRPRRWTGCSTSSAR